MPRFDGRWANEHHILLIHLVRLNVVRRLISLHFLHKNHSRSANTAPASWLQTSPTPLHSTQVSALEAARLGSEHFEEPKASGRVDHNDICEPTSYCVRSSLICVEWVWRRCKKSSEMWTSGAGASDRDSACTSPRLTGVLYTQANANSQSRLSPRSRLRGTTNKSVWRQRGMLLTRMHV